MKHLLNLFAKTLCVLCLLNCSKSRAQSHWVSYSQKIDVKKYIGQNFRFRAQVRAEVADDSAAARLWVRVDKTNGGNFFDNMDKRPVRNKIWKEYSIEGKINKGSEQAVFGVLCLLNGKFYFDNLVFEIETQKNTWTPLFAADFENNKNDLQPGIFINGFGLNSNFKAELIASSNDKATHCLLIEGSNIINYGQNKKAGNYASVNGIKLYYEIYGQGQPLLVLHGNGGSIENASSFYPELIKHYKVIAIDNRAQGNSGDTDEPLTYDKMASDINELLKQLHTDSVYIWGQSDGAILGILLAMDYPEKVKKVLAFGANIQPDSLAIFTWDIKSCEKICRESKDAKEVKLNRLMLDYPNFPYTKLHSIKAPVLIMSGDRDVIRPEHSLKMFQNIPNSQLCILPGTTHGACWEKPDLFLSILHEFFDKPFSMPDTKSIDEE
jgi:pimeloyl-ACP methyl ester carboxylesterase